MAAESVDGQDVRAVYAAAATHVERARRGGGPAFLLLNTYRYRGHHVGDVAREYYRPKSEEQQWRSHRDPVALFKAHLLGAPRVDPAALEAIDQQLTAEMDAAVAFAVHAPYPDPSRVHEDIYA